MEYRYIKIALVFLAFAELFLPIGFFALFDYDEGAFSEATREMLVGGDFITTYLDGDFRFDKPILIYWLQALSVKLFGLNEFAMRFPSSVAALAWAYSIYRFVNKNFSQKSAIISSLFFISSLQINIIAKAAIADSLLNLLITLSMFNIYTYLQNMDKKYLYFAFFTIGLGVLDKGPVAIMIPLVVTFIYLLIIKDLKLFFKMIFDIKGIVIFLIVALPWYLAEYMACGDKFIDGFLLKHNLERFNSSFEHHSGNYFYYFFVVILGFIPFSGYLFDIFKNIKVIFKDRRYLFLMIWFLFVFIFFSFSKTKLPHYVIYGYTPLFIFLGIFFQKYSLKNSIFVVFFLMILLFLPDIAYMLKAKVKDIYALSLIEVSKEYFDLKYQIFIAFGIVMIILSSLSNRSDLFKLFMLGAIFSTLLNFVIIRAYANLAQEPIKEAAIFAKEHHFRVMMGSKLPTFLFYYQHLSIKKDEFKKGDLILLRSNKLKHYSNYKIYFKRSGIYLIEPL